MAGKGSTKDDNQSSGSSRKTTPAKPQEQVIKCPRCDSQNTKFCYYNNYSLAQPRHFCKTCRRYWTNGGALRNVPIGGGCRKNKKLKSATSRLSFDSSKDSSTRSISSELGGLKFFQGISPVAAVDFQLLGGLNFPRVLNSSNLYNNQILNNIPSFGDINLTNSPNPCFNLDPSAPSSSSNPNYNLMGGTINFPFSTTQENIGTNYQSNLASSIESLSSMNQDLHWKLQQQRLAMLFGGGDSQKDSGFSTANQIQKPQPTILFHNLEGGSTSNKEGNNNLVAGGDEDINSRKEGTSTCGGNLATEWFFDPTPTSSSGNENVGSWNEIQAWNNLNQYI